MNQLILTKFFFLVLSFLFFSSHPASCLEQIDSFTQIEQIDSPMQNEYSLSSSCSLSSEDEDDCPECCFRNVVRAQLGYSIGQFTGIRDDYFECDAFATFFPTETFLPFFDFHYYRFVDGRKAASVGLGARMAECGCGMIGGNIYYDFLEGHLGDFNRVGFGFEWLHCSWALRINGYIPINKETHTEFCHFSYLGGYEAFSKKKEYVMGGLDAQIEASLCSWKHTEIIGWIGPYYYHHKGFRDVFGAQAGLDFILSKYLSVQINASCDKVFGTTVQGKLLWTIPFTDCFDCCLEELARPVRRNHLIFTRQRKCWNWNW